jgi:hypothetical protein
MALSHNTEINGIQLQGAYVKVERVTVTKDSLSIELVWRASKKSPPIKNKHFNLPYDLEGANPLAQAYRNLKTLPEFAGAEDC